MKEHMNYIVDHAEEIEKLIKVKAQVSEVKSIMLENIDKVMLIIDSLMSFCTLRKATNHSPLLYFLHDGSAKRKLRISQCPLKEETDYCAFVLILSNIVDPFSGDRQRGKSNGSY